MHARSRGEHTHLWPIELKKVMNLRLKQEFKKGETHALNKGSKNGEVSEWLPGLRSRRYKEHAWRATQPPSTTLEKGEIPGLKQGIKKR